MASKNADFQIHLYEKPYIYHLKDLKKLYKGHLNGTYRFLIGNSEIIYLKYKKMDKMHKKCVFS